MSPLFLVVCLAVSLAFGYDGLSPKDCIGECQTGDVNSTMNRVMHLKVADWKKCSEEHQCPLKTSDVGYAKCVNGLAAGEYPCCNVDLLSFVSLESLGAGGDGNDIWGWTSADGREIAIVCTYDGTSFVDVTSPSDPKVLGFLRTHTVGSSWRDAKVYKDHVYIISEARSHGMQVFDLTQLLTLPTTSVFSNNFSAAAVPQLKETAFYGEFGSCHNIAINEESGYAYAIGSQTCRAGLHIVDIRVPSKPVFVSCFSADGYTHDSQCVIYSGPDHRFTGKEICFNYNEDTLTIVDVTDKQNIVMLSRTSYSGVQYTHQGWLLEGQEFLLLNDELDELYNANHHTRTMLWGVQDLTAPYIHANFLAKQEVIDHNLYTLGDRAYLANYCGGLRILDTTKATQGELTEAAFFDVAPQCDSTEFLGSWSSYPYFKSGTIVVSSIERGLFSLRYNGAATCSA